MAMNRYRPNEHLIGVKGSRAKLTTPALILDLDALEHNISRMAELCALHGVALRPHAKTHKSVRIARMQLAAGAVGICAATVREARVMAAADVSNIHLSSPLVGEVVIGELIALIKEGAKLSVVTDSITGLAALERYFTAAGQAVTVLVDADLQAMYRTGVSSPEAALDLASRIAQSQTLQFGGVQYYSGIVQHIPTAEERSEVYGQQLEKLKALVTLLTNNGLPPPVVTGGGSGTFAIDGQSGVITENQAGSYVVMDVEYGAINVLVDDPKPFHPALFVQTTVISNNARGMVTIDAGSKSIALDGPKPRIASGAPLECVFQILGDEHAGLIFPGVVDPAVLEAGPPPADSETAVYKLFYEIFGGFKGEPGQLEIGTKVELTASHCDPTVNLYNTYHCVRSDTLVDIWPIDARGNL